MLGIKSHSDINSIMNKCFFVANGYSGKASGVTLRAFDIMDQRLGNGLFLTVSEKFASVPL